MKIMFYIYGEHLQWFHSVIRICVSKHKGKRRFLLIYCY